MEDITPADSVVPIYLVPLTKEELAEREQFAAETKAHFEEREAAIAAKESAKAKLAALGLTEDEVLALIGR